MAPMVLKMIWIRFKSLLTFRLAFWVMLVISLFGCRSLFAKTPYALGVQFYYKGQYKDAEKLLLKALAQEKNQKAQSKIKIYLGVVNYMTGKKSEAQKYFKKALILDSKARLNPDDVLDDSVLGFFEATLQSYLSEPKPQPKKKPETTVMVDANVRGIIYYRDVEVGATGDAMKVDPGVLELVIKAPGYKSKSLKVKAKKFKETSIKVTLKRASTKKKPRKKAKKKKVGETWVLLLPLGAGQFQNSSYLLGGFVAGAQVASLFLYFNAASQTDEAKARREAVKRGDFDDDYSNDPVIAAEQKQAKDEEFASFIAERQITQTITLSLAGVFWVGSVIEAYINRPYVKTKKRKSSGFYPAPNGGVGYAMDEVFGKSSIIPTLMEIHPVEKGLSVNALWAF